MPRTPAQLDCEIAAALRKRDVPAAAGSYYYVADRGKHRTIYGPYATREDAELAGYFHKPVAERDSTPANVFFLRGVQQYNDGEIASLTLDPGEWGFKSVKLARRAPPMHASWRTFDAEFRQHIRDRDRELAERLAARRS